MYYDELSEEEDIVAVLMCTAAVQFLGARPAQKRRRRRWWVRPCLRSREVAGHASRLLPELRTRDEEYYRDFLRMPPKTFDTLLDLVRSSITMQDTTFRSAISAADRLAMTIRFLATGQTLRELSYNFLIGRSTACCLVATVCQALWDVLKPLYVKHPRVVDEWLKIAADFEERWQMPHCVGAIGGKHISIESPPNSGSADRNYKGSFSKSLLAVCDAHYRFLYTEMGHFGSESDGGIFAASTLKKNIAGGEWGFPAARPVGSEGPLPYFFVGDEAFPLKEYMMRPYPRQALHGNALQSTLERRIFNYRLSRARRVIENAFGILAQRWRILRRPFKAKAININRYVGACIVLHNYLLKESTESSAMYCPPGSVDTEDWEGRICPGSWRDNDASSVFTTQRLTGCNATRHAKQVREKLTHHFVTAGEVSWQHSMVTDSHE